MFSLSSLGFPAVGPQLRGIEPARLANVYYFSHITSSSRGNLDRYRLNLAYNSYGLPQTEMICIIFNLYSIIFGFKG